MLVNEHSNLVNDAEEVSLSEIFSNVKKVFNYLFTKWLLISIVSVFGVILGFLLAYKTPITYTTKISFVVEDNKAGGSGLASIAGLAGFDVSNIGAGAGLFTGDNILLFLKSTSLSKSALLTEYTQGSNYSLADKYAETYGLKSKWKKLLNKDIDFPVNAKIPFSRTQDSLLNELTKKIILKEFIVERPEKKASFINVTTTMKDENLSKLFTDRLVKIATDRYVFSKTRRQKANVDRLQRTVDSLASLLNNKTYLNAVETEQLLDINPALKTNAVRAELTSRDKVLLGTIFGEIVKNLEIAKMQLNQETPTIYMVDGTDLLPKTNKPSFIIYCLFGGLFLFLLSCVYFIIKFFIRNA
ncbi:MAG: hypothetical protein ACOVNY_11230 [Chitinophagaceae bacterium]